MSTSEIWRPIPGFEGSYEASSYGRIRSLDRTITIKVSYKGKLLRPVMSSDGYLVGGFRKQQNPMRQIRLHRLVAMAFLPNPEGHPIINHKDGNKTNNHIDNLEWVSYVRNALHALETGLTKPYQKFTAQQVIEIRESTLGQKALSKKFSISPSHAWRIRRKTSRTKYN